MPFTATLNFVHKIHGAVNGIMIYERRANTRGLVLFVDDGFVVVRAEFGPGARPDNAVGFEFATFLEGFNGISSISTHLAINLT